MSANAKTWILRPIERPIALILFLVLLGLGAVQWTRDRPDEAVGQLHMALMPACPFTTRGADDESAGLLAQVGLAIAKPIIEKSINYGVAELKRASEDQTAMVAARVAGIFYKQEATRVIVVASRCIVLWRSVESSDDKSIQSALNDEQLKKVSSIVGTSNQVIVDYLEFSLIVDRKTMPTAFRIVPAFVTSAPDAEEVGSRSPILVTLVFEAPQLEGGSPALVASATFPIGARYLPAGSDGVIAYPDQSSPWFSLRQPYAEVVKLSLVRRPTSGKDILEQEERIVQDLRPFSVFATLQWDVPGNQYLGVIADVIEVAKNAVLQSDKDADTEQ